MTTKDIIEHKKKIVRHLANKELKDVFDALAKLTIYAKDWYKSGQLSELETNYKYMLHYLFEGLKDPEREKLYEHLIRSLYELTDDLADDILDEKSTNLFFEKLRSTAPASHSISFFYTQLKDIISSISLVDILGETEDSQRQKRNLAVRRERVESDLFNYVFVSPRTNNKTIEEYYQFVSSIELSSREKCIFISALTLNLFHRFDSFKVQVLMRATTSPHLAVRVRAVVGLVVVMQMYDKRWALYPELQAELGVLSENSNFTKSVENVVIQLIRSRETEKISKKIRDEIIPEMMQLRNKTGLKLNMEDFMNESDLSDKNPEWQKELEDSGLTKKLQEYSNLQIEGADVFHSTFSGLKSFSFFGELSNWFIPFDVSYSDISSLFVSSGKNNILHAAIVESGHMCNSDKYSFCLSLMQISSVQREMMLTRLNSESEEIKQLQKDAKSLNPAIDEEVASNQYIQDLYRFFKLHPDHNDFFDIFRLNINFYEKQSIAPLIYKVDSMRKIALYCFEKNYFEEALYIFKILSEDATGGHDVWQRIAYCEQMLGNADVALTAYLKADLINPNNSWILRHIAQLYRNTQQYDKAVRFYQKVSKLNPDNMSIELAIGHCYLEQKEYENALNSYFKVEMLDTNSDRALRPIAWTTFLTKKFDVSKKYYDRILSENPIGHDYLNAGHVELAMGNSKQALSLYIHTVEMEGQDKFIELFEADREIIMQSGVDKFLLPFLLDQLKYSAI